LKSNILKSVFILFVSVLFFTACEDEPTSLGLENIPDEDKLGLLEINSLEVPMLQRSDFYNAGSTDTTWNLGTSIRLFVGQNSSVKSSMLIKFRSNVEDSIVDYFDSSRITVEKAWIELRPSYTSGENASASSFKVSKINNEWTSTFFNKDSLHQYILPNVSDSRTISGLNDSLISFDISNDMANDWLVSGIKDSSELNYGLLFEPSGNNSMYGFYSLHESNVVDGYDNIPVAKIVINITGVGLDTLNFYSIRDVHVVEGNIPVNDESYIYLQGGYPIRANYYIDVASVPENSIIIDAVLDFYFDPNLTINGSVASNTINLIMYSDSTNRQLLVGTSIKSLQKDSLGNKYSGNITPFVQLWNQDKENQGLYVFLPDEQYTMNRVAVYGNKYNDELLRPKLTIRYTKR